MDYPFYLMQMGQLPPPLLERVVSQCTQDKFVNHPNFKRSKYKGGGYRVVADDALRESIGMVQEFLLPLLPGDKLQWFEINAIAPGGYRLEEHSDLEYTAPVRSKGGTAQDIFLTHKVHVHLAGDSLLGFRRSRNERRVEFVPQPGGVYWYNNYVLHQSDNTGDSHRLALTMVYQDHDWSIRTELLRTLGCNGEALYSI